MTCDCVREGVGVRRDPGVPVSSHSHHQLHQQHDVMGNFEVKKEIVRNIFPLIFTSLTYGVLVYRRPSRKCCR